MPTRHERAQAPSRSGPARPRSPSSAAAAACRLRWPTPPCGAAGASCCSRCAAGPIRNGSPPIRITGPGWASSAASCGSPPRRAAATSPSSARWCGLRSGRCGRIFGALRLMPQLVQTVPRRRRSSAVGHRPAVRAARLPAGRAQGDRAGACSCRDGPIGTPLPREPQDRADIARGLALLRADEPVRHRPGRGRRQQPGAGGGGSGGHRPDAGAGRRAAPRRPHPHAGWASASWSRPPRSARTIASICRRSAPRPSSAASAAGLAGIAVVAGSTIVAEPERIAAAADRAGMFVIGVSADGPDQ